MLHNHIDVSKIFSIEPNDGAEDRVPKKKKKVLKRKLPNETSTQEYQKVNNNSITSPFADSITQ